MKTTRHTTLGFLAIVTLIGTTVSAQTVPPASTAPNANRDVLSSSAPAAPDPFEQHVTALLGQSGGLTSTEAARRAMATSYEVQARHQEIVAAAAALDQAFWSYFPRLSGLARYARLSDIPPANLGSLVAAPSVQVPGPIPAGTQLVNVPLTFSFPSDDVRFQVSLTIPISDYLLRLSQNYASARHSRHGAELNEIAARLRAGFDARISYYNWVRAKLAAVVAEQAVQQAQEHLNDVQHLFTEGAVSQADVLRVRSQLASAQLLVTRAQNLISVGEDSLRTAMHVPPETEMRIGEDVRADLPGMEHADDFALLFNEAMAHRPELLALTETIGALHDSARASRAGYYPRLEGFGDVMTANPNPRFFPPQAAFNTTWEVGAQLTWALNDPFIAHAAASAADARTAQASAQLGSARDQLRGEVMQSFASTHEAAMAVQTTMTGLAAAEESYRVRRVLFRNGRATSVELTDAETDLTRSRLDAINARIDLRVARERLTHATGHDADEFRHN